jgi:hypothetical protein
VYTYTITYNLNRQVRFFDAYDEVYWNATGNGWMFSIEKAGVTITLPEGAVIEQHSGYSGPEGNSDCSCSSSLIASNSVRYEVTSGLNPYEGLTVAVGWQKGIVLPPTAEQEQAESSSDYFDTYSEYAREALRENNGLTYGVGGVLALLTYLMVAWFRVGRDPRTGAIIPRYVPPDGFSPAACRYVLRMGYDAKAFAASIVSMAVKGFLVIDQSKKAYHLKKISDGTSKLTAGEKKVAENIFSGTSSLTLDNTYDVRVSNAVDQLKQQLQIDFRNLNFSKNYGWMVPAIFLGLGVIVFMLWEVRSFFEIIVLPIIIVSRDAQRGDRREPSDVRRRRRPGRRNVECHVRLRRPEPGQRELRQRVRSHRIRWRRILHGAPAGTYGACRVAEAAGRRRGGELCFFYIR